MKCVYCNTTSTPFFISIGNKAICINCKSLKSLPKKSSISLPTKPRIFTLYKCHTHSCHTYNINNMSRHRMKTCIIEKLNTVGLISPRTKGGHNGDIGRQWFADHYREMNEVEIKEKATSYKKFASIKWKKRKNRHERAFYLKHILFKQRKDIDLKKQNYAFMQLNMEYEKNIKSKLQRAPSESSLVPNRQVDYASLDSYKMILGGSLK